MKYRFLLFCVLSAIPAFGQTQTPCVINFTFTASGQASTVTAGNCNQGDNRQAGAYSWTMQYESTGFSAVTLTIQSAPGPLTPGSWVTYAGTIDTGINPNTSTSGATTTAHNGTASIPWIRMALTATGSGTVRGVLIGVQNGAAAGGSSSGGCPDPCPVVGTASSGSVPSGAPVQIAGSDGTDIRTVSTDNTGRVNVNAAITPSGTQDVNLKQVNGDTVVTGGVNGSQGVGGLAASGAAATGNPVLGGGIDGSNNARSFHTDSNGDLATYPIGLGTLTTGQQAVTGSAVALPSNSAANVCVKALIANTINVYAGPTGVTTSTGWELPPGQGQCWSLSNSNLVFVIASTTGASVSWSTTVR